MTHDQWCLHRVAPALANMHVCQCRSRADGRRLERTRILRTLSDAGMHAAAGLVATLPLDDVPADAPMVD